MIRINRQRAEEIIKAGMPMYTPGMSLFNATGDVSETTTGYDFAIRSTSFIAAKSVVQKFYEVRGGLGAYVPVIEGEGSYLEDIRINREFSMGNPFETSRVSTGFGRAKIGNVNISNAPVTIKFSTFRQGLEYDELDVEKAMRSQKWDVIGGLFSALKKWFDLGVQKVAFLGLLDDLTNTPGLLTQTDVTDNTTRITAKISTLSAADFQTFVALVVGDYRSNCSKTAWPDTFLMPEADWVGMATAASTTAALGSKMSYLLQAFKEITGNDNFKILCSAYNDAAGNAGYVSAGGKQRYVLYKNDAETIRMEHPVPYTLTPSVRVGAQTFEAAATQQISGAVGIAKAQMMYYSY